MSSVTAGPREDASAAAAATPGAGDEQSQLLAVYRAMVTARCVDRHQADLVRRGDAYFHIPGEGHEPIAALGPHLTPDDWLAAHYRDKALLLFRGIAPEAFLASSLCRSTAPGGGRQLPDIIGSRAHRVLSTPVPVGNHALHAVGVAAAEAQLHPDGNSIAVCICGDGTSQQGELLEAVCEAIRRRLPVLFVVEDNGFAISTRTAGMTIVSTPDGPARDFLGVPITHVVGREVRGALAAFGAVVEQVRATRRPAIVALAVERLTSHTNADDQRAYRSAQELAGLGDRDPIAAFARDLATLVPALELESVRAAAEHTVAVAAERALAAPAPHPTESAKAPLPELLVARDAERWLEAGDGPGTMAEAIRAVLGERLARDPRVVLVGQDVEDPKGDVFGVTRGLSTRFPERVVNAALSESTIVGTAIGRALAGQRPIALIQFADFLPLAFNQIANELGTMFWRTAGEYSCPVVVMAPCGGYKPGMGPFHAQTFDGTAVHLPGIDVVMPSTPGDACGLLNNALESPRPTLFLYPKALLNVSETARRFDAARHRVAIGAARLVRRGNDLTIVAWGNTVRLACRVADAIEEQRHSVDVIDLRSLSPWDEACVLESVGRTGRLLVVHEDNLTGGLGGEIAARVAERAARQPRILRVARQDVPIPCHFDSQLTVLPSFRSTLTAAAQLLDLELAWEEPEPDVEFGTLLIRALGSGPSDDTVLVSQLSVRPGDQVAADDVVAVVECSKCAVEIAAPQAGVVVEVRAREGEEVRVGETLVSIRADAPSRREGPRARPEPRPRFGTRSRDRGTPCRPSSGVPVRLAAVRGAIGGRVVRHEEILPHHPHRMAEEVTRLTGIHSRRWLADGEDPVSLGVLAARRALADAAVEPAELDLVICATTTPSQAAPSMACQIAARLGGTRAPAYDLSAACSGYLFALCAAHDFLQAHPSGRALVLTAEALSTRTDVRDFDTAFLFGDAATATVLATDTKAGPLLHRPVLSSKADGADALFVPLTPEHGYLRMKGGRVFTEAVREMSAILDRACAAAGVSVADLDAVVPHQANGRILDAVEARVGRPVVRHLRDIGNTSSSSIPLALEARLAQGTDDRLLGLCCFGAGFTSGAAVVDVCGVREAAKGGR